MKLKLLISRLSKTHALSRGFTLVELMVSIGIMFVITAIVVLGRAQYDGSILLTNLAYDIALSIREAQVYGVNVRKSSGVDSFGAGYGIHIPSASATSYTLFADLNNNHAYDSGTELVRAYTIRNGNRVAGLCAGSNCSASTLNITFRRPDPDACISTGAVYIPNTTIFAKLSSQCVLASGNNKANIIVQSSSGAAQRCITVYTTGQVSVASTCQ